MRPKIYAMIPARIGSQRLKLKNLALLNNKPLIYYAIHSAKNSKVFDKIFINSDDAVFKKIANRYKIDFYKRRKNLGSSNAKSDGANMLHLDNLEKLLTNLVAIKKLVNSF